jgi:hypothetical protein
MIIFLSKKILIFKCFEKKELKDHFALLFVIEIILNFIKQNRNRQP